MSTRYRVDLYFPAGRLKDALLAAGHFAEFEPPADAVEFALAEITGQDPSQVLDVVLPDGERLRLPFKLEFERAPVHLAPWCRVFFNTILRFPLDDAIRDFLKRNYRNPADRNKQIITVANGTEEAAIGYMDLAVTMGNRFVEFSFLAANHEMSVLFCESPSIHARFLSLLQESGGLFGLLWARGNERPLLGHEDRRIWVDMEQFLRSGDPSDAGASRIDIDALVEDVLAQPGVARPE